MSHSVYMCAGISGKDLEERDGGFPSSYQYHFWVAIEVAMRARAVAGWRSRLPTLIPLQKPLQTPPEPG